VTLLGVILIFCAVSVASSADVYVSPTGNDAAAGTSAAPLATLAAARDKADQLKANNTPVTVYLRGGTYYLGAPVVFGPANSGTATAPIVYTAYSGEKPVISGGIKVTSAWTASSANANIMVTTIAQNLKVDQLFLNGTRQVLARYPNFNANTVILNGYANYASDCASPTRVAKWANPTEGPGYVRALHINNWGGNSFTITAKNATNNTLTLQWSGDNNRGQGIDQAHALVENIFEELDAAGEWFYRKSTGQLFFWPPAGTNLSTATIELASQDELLRFVGTSAATAGSVKYIQFNGVTFTHTFRTLFSVPYEFVFASDWAIARAGAIFMQDAENITIQNCLFDQVGGNGIFVSGYNRSHLIYNNVFNYTGASCVALMGLQSCVRCPNAQTATPTCTDKTPGPLTNEYPASIRVDNYMMNHLGIFEKQPAGIALSATESDTLIHNTIHDCPRAGICFCDGCFGGHQVEYNWVYNSVLETGDHGPFNAWGRDRISRWQNDTSTARLDAWKTTYVHNNRFEVKPYDFGIDLDDQASNYYQYNNLCIGGGLKLQWTMFNTYINNILYNSMTECHGTWSNSHHYNARNVTVNYAPYSFCCFTNLTAATNNPVPADVHAAVLQIDSNCVWSFGAGPTFTNFDDRSAHLFTWANWQAGGNDLHSVVADPMFTDSNKTWPNYSPKGDFSVKTGSPALALGFKNFPMDSFGVMPPNTAARLQSQTFMNSANRPDNSNFLVHYTSGSSIAVPAAYVGAGFVANIYDLLGKKLGAVSLEKKGELRIPAAVAKTQGVLVVKIEKGEK
jgi:hypothetical protein